MLPGERHLADAAVEVPGGEGHHHRPGQQAPLQPAQVLGHGDDRVRPVVLHGVGSVGVRVEDHELVGAAGDHPDDVAADDVLGGGGQGEPDRSAGRGQRLQLRPDRPVHEHPGNVTNMSVIGEVRARRRLRREVDDRDAADGPGGRQAVEQRDEIAHAGPGPGVPRRWLDEVLRVPGGVGDLVHDRIGGRRGGHVQDGDPAGQRSGGRCRTRRHAGQDAGDAARRRAARVRNVGRRGDRLPGQVERPSHGRPTVDRHGLGVHLRHSRPLEPRDKDVDITLVGGRAGRAQPQTVELCVPLP
jgi:hypothetical protein